MNQAKRYLPQSKRRVSTWVCFFFFIGIFIGQRARGLCEYNLSEIEIKISKEHARHLNFPNNIQRLHINIGPNVSPIVPIKSDESLGVLVVEANLGIASMLRNEYQKKRFPFQFFVLSAAVADRSRAGLSNFHFYNNAGQSSSLSVVNPKRSHAIFEDRNKYNPSGQYEPGPTAIDFVPTITLDTVLRSIPDNISIELLKIDAQGHDLDIIKSAPTETVRRVQRILSEVFLSRQENIYSNISNGYVESVSYMKSIGYTLKNPPVNPKNGHYLDADWQRI